jgi:membrane-associated phospholipid phosphatase
MRTEAATARPLDARLAEWASDTNGDLRPGRLALVLAGGYVVFTATYVPINVFSVGREAHTLFLPGEERLPFLPVFEYLYVLSYFAGVQMFFGLRDAGRLRHLLRATAIALLVAYATYLVYPVYFQRPHLEVTSLHTWLLSLSYHDKPYNHFPSLHVTLSWLTVHAAQVSRGYRAVLALVAIGISVSTLFVKQHYFVDVVYGFLLAWMAWRLAAPRGT